MKFFFLYITFCYLLFFKLYSNQEFKFIKNDYSHYNRENIYTITIQNANHLDGFNSIDKGSFHSYNDNGLSNYFRTEFTIDDSILNYNQIDFSCYVDAENLKSDFEPMGLALQFLLTFVDNSKEKILLHIDEGNYANSLYTVSHSVDKIIKNIYVSGFHRGSSAQGYVCYKDIKLNFISRNLIENVIKLENNYLNIDNSYFPYYKKYDFNKITKYK